MPELQELTLTLIGYHDRDVVANITANTFRPIWNGDVGRRLRLLRLPLHRLDHLGHWVRAVAAARAKLCQLHLVQANVVAPVRATLAHQLCDTSLSIEFAALHRGRWRGDLVGQLAAQIAALPLRGLTELSLQLRQYPSAANSEIDLDDTGRQSLTVLSNAAARLKGCDLRLNW